MRAERIQNRRWILSSREETRTAAVAIAACAKRSLAILTPDMEPGIYDHEEFLDVAKRLVLSKRYARIRVLVSDPARAIRNGNRFVGMARRLNTYIELRNAHPDYQGHREALLIADDEALLYRVDSARWEGIADSYDPLVTRRYLELFDSIWNVSEPGQEFREVRV
ncbi:MAG: hypothetical protein IT486_03485 [Gammaproteobacteria bacterium]|nr:hypothetical protein [Gammaproteobacteria bacterium]